MGTGVYRTEIRTAPSPGVNELCDWEFWKGVVIVVLIMFLKSIKFDNGNVYQNLFRFTEKTEAALLCGASADRWDRSMFFTSPGAADNGYRLVQDRHLASR